MTRSTQVMLFIDADNVSADVIEQAVAKVLADHGAIHVRRAYCTAEAAVQNAKLFKRLSIRPMVNLVAGKNCTDIALAVDAIDLVSAERPDIAVIVSSDSDFAPLVIRLREKGCRVLGIGQKGKTGEESIGVYDEFVDLQHRAARPARPTRSTALRTSVAPIAAPPVPPAPAPASPTRRGTRSSRGRSGTTASAPVRPPLPDEIERVLAAIPELRDGAPYELRHAAERLRSAGLLANSAPSTKLFKKHPEYFTLAPQRQPNKVQFRNQSAE
jgi:uncharacterized protein (TIGR00288 family)